MLSINCDMGESFGLYKMGDDEGVMPFITHANIACGFHASDPDHMYRTVLLAKKNGIKMGAHFALPDLQGFGRREMSVSRKELLNIVVYQIGALSGFLKIHGVEMSHLKPHGALYGMAAKQEAVAEAIADAAEIYNLPVMGMSNTIQEEVLVNRKLGFIPEFFADLDYGDKGELIITREHGAVDPIAAAEKCIRAVNEQEVSSINGKSVSVQVESICIHSDTPGAVEIAKAVHLALQPYLS